MDKDVVDVSQTIQPGGEEVMKLSDFIGQDLPAKVEPKVTEPIKDDSAKETPSPAAVDSGETETPPVAPLTKKQDLAYNLDDIAEEDRPLFKKMSNDAAQKVVSWYKERKTAAAEYAAKEAALRKEIEETRTKAQIPASWYEHPDAYVLSPKFREAAGRQQQLGTELDFWKKQYKAIRRGEDWQDVQQAQNGNWQYVKREADADSEAEVLANMQRAQSMMEDAAREVENVRSSFQSQHKSVTQRIAEASQKFFPEDLRDFDKALKDNQYVKAMHNALDEINQTSNPLAKAFCQLYAVHMKVLADNVALTKKPIQQKPNNITSKEASSGIVTKASTEETLSFEDFASKRRQD